MRILYVYQGDWPHNATRPRKQTQALASAGHSVRLLSGNPRGLPRYGAEPWMEIERVPRLGPRGLDRVLGFPLFVNPFWTLWMRRSARAFRADALIVRDLPLAPAALAVGRMLGIPVHYEMADVYPIALRANVDAHPGLLSRIARRPEVAEWLDRLVIRRADSVFVVSEESRQRCLAIGASADAAVVVGNTPDELPDPRAAPEAPADVRDWVGRPLVVFLGNLLSDRGLTQAVDAIGIARASVPDIGFLIIGDGPEHAKLAAQIDAQGLRDHVRLLGWKNYTEHAGYYRVALLGVLPFLPTEHINITLANKLFDYMASSLAVVASDVPPMRRVLEETGAGVLVPPGNAAALAAAFADLLRDPARCRALGLRGRAAVEGRYNWSADRGRFLQAVARNGRSA